MTEQGKPVLLTEAEAKVLWQASFSQHAKTFKNYCTELRERGLIAPEPNTLEEHATELVREYLETTMGAHDLALAALRRGKELGQAAARPLTLTEKQVRRILHEHIDRIHIPTLAPHFIAKALHTALLSQMEGRDG